MNNEELEREIKRLEEQIKDLKIKLEEKAEKKPFEVEVPWNIEDYVYIVVNGDIYSADTLSDDIVKKIYKRGVIFKNKEEAKQFDKERILINKLKNWAEEHNESWYPDWEDGDEIKYFIIYDNRYKTLKVDYYSRIKPFSKLPYFKSEEIAEQFIEEFGDEIKEVLY